jgi:hypothetical protein
MVSLSDPDGAQRTIVHDLLGSSHQSRFPIYSLSHPMLTLPRCCKPGPRVDGKARGALRDDINSASDSSAEEDVEEPSSAPAPDADVTYSYDAERGPSHGSQILGIALARAVERYEVRQTDKLIKEEYEVLDVARDALSPGPKVSNKKVAPEDEDYEFIEA